MSIKSMGKIAAVAAAAGLALTACADESVTQPRDQQETCGLIFGAETKATEGLQTVSATMQQGEGSTDRAAQALESAALDVRNHSFDRSDDQQNPDTGEAIPLHTALQVHAASFDEMSSAITEGMEALQNFDPTTFEVEGMTYPEAVETINGYCASYAQQQMPQQQMPQQQMPEGLPEEEAPAPEEQGGE